MNKEVELVGLMNSAEMIVRPAECSSTSHQIPKEECKQELYFKPRSCWYSKKMTFLQTSIWTWKAACSSNFYLFCNNGVLFFLPFPQSLFICWNLYICIYSRGFCTCFTLHPIIDKPQFLISCRKEKEVVSVRWPVTSQRI